MRGFIFIGLILMALGALQVAFLYSVALFHSSPDPGTMVLDKMLDVDEASWLGILACAMFLVGLGYFAYGVASSIRRQEK